MKHLISIKSLATVAVALGAFAAASSAQARSDVYFSIGVQTPGFYVQPAPVYVQPRSYYTPAPRYYQRHDNGRHYGWQQQQQRRGPYGDFDRDGIRNQQDRDRDGDGVRNRFDRFPNNPNRR
ncbi:thrombospondin type 3 repeat-containing protein [Rhodoferax sp.]|uniref:thrombospondin type 3 repeat-containing protein n=1 Tax=Rhodoferax sp. TaxID=50421 RepID=UPI00272F94E9|nr:thrombospondin type 3 repeat-containing protein [Rhodoferax sp.]MDP2441253.1 thrombospondin type 3 repeat-containing protein [Rhodoferax sp.]MDZ4207910.1 thrombospondin type 3 repeat-containing protein [Rhodoferax sp.]